MNFENILEKVAQFVLSVKFVGPIVSIFVGYVMYLSITGVINKVSKKRKRSVNHKKEETVINLIKNIIKYIIIIIVVLVILEIYGINTTSIIASLGVAGLVIGLALQDTIKNMLAGVFIIFDNRYNVGDFVEINNFQGEVISLGLQTTKVKAGTGEVFSIANSVISSVINFTESDTNLVMNIGVSYKTDINHLEKVLGKLNSKVKKIENVIGDLKLLGVDAFNPSEISYKISVLCKPNTHYAIKREILKLVKIEFDKEGIEIPYNQVDLHVIDSKKVSRKSVKKK